MKRQTMSRKRRLVEESGVSADRAITQPAIRHPIMDQVVKSQTCRLPYCLRTQKGSCRTYRWMTASEQASKKRRVGKPAVPNGTSKEGSAFTASNFYAVCTRKDSTPCDALVKRLLQPKGFTTAATEHGKQHESVALQLYATEKETVVQPCGLFIDLKHGFLAATPDGLVGTDRIVEVKCPLKYKEHEPLEAARNFSEKKQRDGALVLSRSHSYYFYQVQGQLHITGRIICDFVVYTTKGIHVQEIRRDDAFWRAKMEPFLLRFYKDCILPEIVDSRLAEYKR